MPNSSLVVILIVLDLRLTFRAKAFREGRIELGRRECMVLHGAISLVFLIILILVLIKPFGLRRRQAQLDRNGDAIPQLLVATRQNSQDEKYRSIIWRKSRLIIMVPFG